MISLPLSQLKPEYDVVVVGSGYGGAISASRLARARKADGTPVRVCLLERGGEIPTGRFPTDSVEALRQFQVSAPGSQLGSEDALYWLHKGPDISVLHGCGLGGTSLINANVSLPPDPRVWTDERWPRGIREDLEHGVAAGFAAAEDMLNPVAYTGTPALRKLNALKRSGARLGATTEQVYCPPINVTFVTGTNAAGVEQHACTLCGDCVAGCNVGAKNSLAMNYLPDARRHGAEIFCHAAARYVEPAGTAWRVYFKPVGAQRDKFDGPELFVTCKLVILAAGSLGSTEILLRSHQRGLPSSARLGENFSGNGDVLGFSYNNDEPINGLGMGRNPVDPSSPIGPCISGIVDMRKTKNFADGFVIEEGSIPGAIADALSEPMALVAKVSGVDTDDGFWDELRERSREWLDALPGRASDGAMARTQTFLVMAHDGADGRLRLEQDQVALAWPGVGERPLFQRLNGALLEAAAATGGTYVASPLFNKAFGHELISVHALGGCSMADDASRGATNHKGQVFSHAAGTAVHQGLYVSDGAILPCSVGVNPLLTISALAERNVRLLARDWGWAIDQTVDRTPVPFGVYFTEHDRLKIKFTERMAGHCSTRVLGADSYLEAEKDGQQHGSGLEFVLTMSSDDLDRMIADPNHVAEAVGTVSAPALSRAPLTVYGGSFNLFVNDRDDPRVQRMRYRLPLRSVEGKAYFFDGFKLIRDDPGQDLWSDTTTLFVTVTQGHDGSGAVVAKGIVHIAPEDFAKQMTTMDARDCRDHVASKGVTAFGRLFAKDLWEQYGIDG